MSLDEPATTDWHALDPDAALQLCGTDATLGLAAAVATRRLAEHGPNALPEPPPRPLWRT